MRAFRAAQQEVVVAVLLVRLPPLLCFPSFSFYLGKLRDWSWKGNGCGAVGRDRRIPSKGSLLGAAPRARRCVSLVAPDPSRLTAGVCSLQVDVF